MDVPILSLFVIWGYGKHVFYCGDLGTLYKHELYKKIVLLQWFFLVYICFFVIGILKENQIAYQPKGYLRGYSELLTNYHWLLESISPQDEENHWY